MFWIAHYADGGKITLSLLSWQLTEKSQVTSGETNLSFYSIFELEANWKYIIRDFIKSVLSPLQANKNDSYEKFLHMVLLLFVEVLAKEFYYNVLTFLIKPQKREKSSLFL